MTTSRARSRPSSSPTKLKGKKIAVVHDKTTYGQGLADETKKAMNKLGVKEVLYEGVNTGEKDYSALVSKIKSSGADYLYWGGLHTEGGLIVRQMRDQGVKAVMISGDGITSDEFATIGGPGVEGTLMTFPPDPRKRPEAKAVVAKFEAKKFNPEAYTLYSYAAVQIMAQAAEKAKSLDPKKVAEAMHSGMTFKTVIGDHRLRQEGRHHPSRLHALYVEEGQRRQDHLRRELRSSQGKSGKGAFGRPFSLSSAQATSGRPAGSDVSASGGAPGPSSPPIRHRRDRFEKLVCLSARIVRSDKHCQSGAYPALIIWQSRRPGGEGVSA